MLENQLEDAIIHKNVETLENLLTTVHGAANLILTTGEPPLNLAIKISPIINKLLELLLRFTVLTLTQYNKKGFTITASSVFRSSG